MKLSTFKEANQLSFKMVSKKMDCKKKLRWWFYRAQNSPQLVSAHDGVVDENPEYTLLSKGQLEPRLEHRINM